MHLEDFKNSFYANSLFIFLALLDIYLKATCYENKIYVSWCILN